MNGPAVKPINEGVAFYYISQDKTEVTALAFSSVAQALEAVNGVETISKGQCEAPEGGSLFYVQIYFKQSVQATNDATSTRRTQATRTIFRSR